MRYNATLLFWSHAAMAPQLWTLILGCCGRILWFVDFGFGRSRAHHPSLRLGEVGCDTTSTFKEQFVEGTVREKQKAVMYTSSSPCIASDGDVGFTAQCSPPHISETQGSIPPPRTPSPRPHQQFDHSHSSESSLISLCPSDWPSKLPSHEKASRSSALLGIQITTWAGKLIINENAGILQGLDIPYKGISILT